MNKIAIILATGFEDTEFVGTADMLDRAKIPMEFISIENKNKVTGQQNIVTQKTIKFEDVDFNDYQGIFLPGGSGHQILLKSEELKNIIRKYFKEGKIVSAICASPEVLKQAGITEGKIITSYPGFATGENNTGNEYEVDGNLITGQGVEATVAFGKILAEEIIEREGK